MTNARNLANLLGTKTKVKDVDVDGTELILDADGDTSITADTDDQIDFKTGGSDRVTIDSSGNTFVSKNSASRTTVGHEFKADGFTRHTVSGDKVLEIVRTSSDGEILEFFKDTTLIGHVSSRGGADLYIGSGDTNLKFAAGTDVVVPANTDGADRDNAVDLGNSSSKFKDLYLGGGLYVGGTGSANHLDDYEEGSFTVQFLNDGSTTYNKQIGRYHKIGRMVVASFHLDITSNSLGSNQLKISLPFTTANLTSTFGNSGGFHCGGWSTTNKPDNGIASPNTAQCSLFNSGGQASAVSVTGNDIGTGNCLGHCIFEVAS